MGIRWPGGGWRLMEASRGERVHAPAGGTVYRVTEAVGGDKGAGNIHADCKA